MPAQLISGTQMSKKMRDELKRKVDQLKGVGIEPGLAVILVGEDPASNVYVNRKEKTCQELGIYSEVHRLAESISEVELLQQIETLNRDPNIHGILVQLPVPPHISEKAVIDAIAVDKDVDGFHPVNVGNLMIGEGGLLPCTPAGVVEMIKQSGLDIAGKHAVIVGRSNIVGKPAAMLLLREHATVSICHSRTPDLAAITTQADILIVATGRPNTIEAHHVKPGAVIIDVGVNRLENGKLAGDVDFHSVVEKAGWITPVPGGVGPMTITMLMANTLQAAEKLASR